MKLKIAVGLFALAVSGVSFAAHCPADMKLIDEKLATNPQLSEAQMTEVKSLRAQGEDLHKAGKHGESVDTLHKAMVILGIEKK